MIVALLSLLLTSAARAQDFAYEVTFSGAGGEALPDELAELLPSVSQLQRMQDRPPLSQAGLERRIQNDLALLDEALRSEGYYASAIQWRIQQGQPLQVHLTIDPGKRFVFGDFTVEFPPEADLSGLPQPNLDEVGIRLGQPARAEEVLVAERRMTDFLRNNGFPLAKVASTRVAVELTTHEMQVTLRMDPGPVADFGPLAISGLERLDESYLRRRIAWPEGERYSAQRLESVRRDLVSMNLYDAVTLQTAAQPLPDGSLPVSLAVKERAPRTVGLGAGFTTAQGGSFIDGFSFDAFWEHRNLFGEAESLRFETTISLPLQRALALFRKPDFMELRQTLVLSTEARHEDTDAFKELSLMGYGGIERPLAEHLTFAGGFSLELLRIDDLDPSDKKGAENYVIAALPTALIYDDRADPMNPIGGVNAKLLFTPAMTFLERTTPYAIADLTAATYYAPFEDDSLVLAARGRLGGILGGSLEAIPASKRFYAGGGGSVRGYELRSLGPLDADGDPTGGLSVFEVGFEARTRFLDDYGLVAFVEGGQVYEDIWPDFGETPLFAAGIGLRYFTVIGPIRLDVATPLNGRDRDDAFQFYVSIGQAF